MNQNKLYFIEAIDEKMFGRKGKESREKYKALLRHKKWLSGASTKACS